jgi:hypothetical protein
MVAPVQIVRVEHSHSPARGYCASFRTSKCSVWRAALCASSKLPSLCLATAGRPSVGRSSCGNTISIASTRGGETPASFTNGRHLFILHLH